MLEAIGMTLVHMYVYLLQCQLFGEWALHVILGGGARVSGADLNEGNGSVQMLQFKYMCVKQRLQVATI